MDFQIIDQRRLLISFSHEFFKYFDEISALLILVELNFDNKTYSILDQLAYRQCYYSVLLLRDESHLVLVHTFAVDTEGVITTEELDKSDLFFQYDGDQFLGYFKLEINENRICQSPKERVVFDFDFETWKSAMKKFHLYDDKLWYIRDNAWHIFKPVSLELYYL